MNPYFAFWNNGYGQTPKSEEFKDQKKLLEFITKAKADPDGHRDLIVIQGIEVEFEPHLIVQSWRIKG